MLSFFQTLRVDEGAQRPGCFSNREKRPLIKVRFLSLTGSSNLLHLPSQIYLRDSLPSSLVQVVLRLRPQQGQVEKKQQPGL